MNLDVGDRPSFYGGVQADGSAAPRQRCEVLAVRDDGTLDVDVRAVDGGWASGLQEEVEAFASLEVALAVRAPQRAETAELDDAGVQALDDAHPARTGRWGFVTP